MKLFVREENDRFFDLTRLIACERGLAEDSLLYSKGNGFPEALYDLVGGDLFLTEIYFLKVFEVLEELYI